MANDGITLHSEVNWGFTAPELHSLGPIVDKETFSGAFRRDENHGSWPTTAVRRTEREGSR